MPTQYKIRSKSDVCETWIWALNRLLHYTMCQTNQNMSCKLKERRTLRKRRTIPSHFFSILGPHRLNILYTALLHSQQSEIMGQTPHRFAPLAPQFIPLVKLGTQSFH